MNNKIATRQDGTTFEVDERDEGLFPCQEGGRFAEKLARHLWTADAAGIRQRRYAISDTESTPHRFYEILALDVAMDIVSTFDLDLDDFIALGTGGTSDHHDIETVVESGVRIVLKTAVMWGVDRSHVPDDGVIAMAITEAIKEMASLDVPGGVKRDSAAEFSAKALWGLLDDIDTASDDFKENDKGYRRFAEKTVAKRHRYGKSDGYRITLPTGLAPASPASTGDAPRAASLSGEFERPLRIWVVIRADDDLEVAYYDDWETASRGIAQACAVACVEVGFEGRDDARLAAIRRYFATEQARASGWPV